MYIFVPFNGKKSHKMTIGNHSFLINLKRNKNILERNKFAKVVKVFLNVF
jgi:hypothetical protein